MTTKKPTKKTTKKAPKQEGTSLVIPSTVLKITLPKKQVSDSYEQTLTSLTKNVSAAGFRKGKVPKDAAEEKLGKQRIIEQTLNQLLPEAYEKAVKDSKKTPITQPEFSIIEAELGKDWVIEARFAELPTVKLGNYSQLVKKGLKEAKKTLTERKKDEKQPKITEDQEKELNLQHIFRELVLNIKPQVPELLLKHETQHEFEHMVGQLKQLGTSVDDYLQKRQMNMEQLSQELAISTLNRLQLDLILGAIAKEEKLKVTDKDRDEYFKQIPDEKQREQLKNDAHYLGHLDTNLTKQKVVDHLLSI